MIRHGESIWNVLRQQYPGEEERYHPRMWTIDCDITDRGVQQARRAGEHLASEIDGIDLFIVSPLRRALQTAHLVLETLPYEPKKVLISKDVSEVMLDPCDIGSSPERLSKEFPEWDFSHLEESWWYGGLSSEETLAQMKERNGLENEEAAKTRIGSLVAFLRQIESGNILIVCHGDLIWGITSCQKKGEAWGLRAENGEVIDITSYIDPEHSGEST